MAALLIVVRRAATLRFCSCVGFEGFEGNPLWRVGLTLVGLIGAVRRGSIRLVEPWPVYGPGVHDPDPLTGPGTQCATGVALATDGVAICVCVPDETGRAGNGPPGWLRVGWGGKILYGPNDVGGGVCVVAGGGVVVSGDGPGVHVDGTDVGPGDPNSGVPPP